MWWVQAAPHNRHRHRWWIPVVLLVPALLGPAGAAASTEAPGAAGAQPSEEWSDTYTCVGPPGLDCPPQIHTYEVTNTHSRMVLDVRITAPTVTCCNTLLVGLTAPNGQPVTEGIALGPHLAGETVRVIVEDPDLLARQGEWNAFLDTPDTGAMIVPYDARVSFQPYHPADLLDPAGDAETPWVDIQRMWIDRHVDGVPRIHLQMAGPVAVPDLGTGGTGGPTTTYRVDFDTVDADGERIGTVGGQHVRLDIYEALVNTYLCIHLADGNPCTRDEGASTVNADTITWDLASDPGAAALGPDLHFDNIWATTATGIVAVSEQIVDDRAPDTGVERGVVLPPPDTDPVTAQGIGPATPTPPDTMTATLVAATVGATAVALGAWLVRPLSRVRLPRGAFGLALFTRIQRDDALRHERRAALFDAIQAEPGVTFSELRQRLGIGSGSLAHHLRVLEQQDLIAHQGDGQRRRFHLRGPAVTLGPYLSPRQRTLVEAIQREPGSTPTRLAARVGLPRHAVQYHLARLVAGGHVRRRRQGRHAQYYA